MHVIGSCTRHGGTKFKNIVVHLAVCVARASEGFFDVACSAARFWDLYTCPLLASARLHDLSLQVSSADCVKATVRQRGRECGEGVYIDYPVRDADTATAAYRDTHKDAFPTPAQPGVVPCAREPRRDQFIETTLAGWVSDFISWLGQNPWLPFLVHSSTLHNTPVRAHCPCCACCVCTCT
jgi:hypothetical protein